MKSVGLPKAEKELDHMFAFIMSFFPNGSESEPVFAVVNRMAQGVPNVA
jgi:hypothetical protein